MLLWSHFVEPLSVVLIQSLNPITEKPHKCGAPGDWRYGFPSAVDMSTKVKIIVAGELTIAAGKRDANVAEYRVTE